MKNSKAFGKASGFCTKHLVKGLGYGTVGAKPFRKWKL